MLQTVAQEALYRLSWAQMNWKTPRRISHPLPVFWHERRRKTFEIELTSTNTVDSTVKYYYYSFLEYPYTFLRTAFRPTYK